MTEQQFLAALLDFRSAASFPRLRPDPAYLRNVGGCVRSMFSARHLDADFAGLLRTAILNGLYRLDALPRDDPFWEGTNRRPTLYKLSELAGRAVLRPAPEEWACWAFAATSLLGCTNDFGLPGWEGLHRLGRLDGAWPAHAAFHVWCECGFDPRPALLAFLNKAGACVAARNALEALEARPDEAVANWARAAARGCRVRLDPAWLAFEGGVVVKLARAIRQELAWGQLPVLADALEEAGCRDTGVLGHLRGPGPHPKGACWVVDAVLGGLR